MPRHTQSKTSQFPSKFADRAVFGLIHGQRGSHFDSSDYTPSNSLPSSEDIYRELDGAVARQAGKSWKLQVLAIHDDGSERWIQVSVAGGFTRHDLVLHMTDRTRARDAVACIEGWLAYPLTASRVIRVA